jgi:parallel beta-helix repeat protein
LLPGAIRYELVPEEESQEGLTVQYHQWNVQVPAGSAETVAFTIVPSMTGYFDLGSSAVYVSDRDYWTLPVTVTVMCNPNGTCDAGENYVTCPEDCQTGILDDLCDMVADGFQDPDCAYGVDPDYFPLADTDGDGVLDGFDACHLTPDGEPVDTSGCACAQKICDDENEETVDRCDWATAWCGYLPDADQDEIPDSEDNCPNTFNPGQEDWDDDGTGDQCTFGYIESDVTLQPGTYYIADSELDGALTIITSNVVLDCNGATIVGDGQGYGVYVPFYVSNVTIRNCTVQGYRYGVFVDGGGLVQITDNVLQQNVYGIVLGYAADNTVSGNTVSHNTADGIYLEGADGNSIDSNTALSNGQGGIFVHTSNNNDISNNWVCYNPYSDFIVFEATNTGSNNTCNEPGDWNDDGAFGCTFSCGYEHIYLPLVVKNQ